MIVAKNLGQGAGIFDASIEHSRPTRRQKLHMPPMMLHAFPPIVEIFVMAGGESLGKSLARGLVATAHTVRHDLKIVGIDGKAGDGRLKRREGSQRIRDGGAFEVALRSIAPLHQPSAQRLSGRHRRVARIVGSEFVDRVDQSMGIASRREPEGNGTEPIGQIVEHRIGEAGPDQREEGTQPLQAFACAMDAAMAIGGGPKRTLGIFEFGKRDAPHALAHRQKWVEFVAHLGPLAPSRAV